MRFKVGELAVLAYKRNDYGRIATGVDVGDVVEIAAVGPWGEGACLPNGEHAASPADYLVAGGGLHRAVLDCQLIKLSDPDKAEELTEELENAIP